MVRSRTPIFITGKVSLPEDRSSRSQLRRTNSMRLSLRGSWAVLWMATKSDLKIFLPLIRYDLRSRQSRIFVPLLLKARAALPSFGEKLKDAREKRKISLEQISASTKIGTRMLQALEEDKFNQLPGGIFNKGFVRAYSRCLGLDEDQTVAEYLQASGDAPPPRTEIVSREDEARENEEHVRRLEAVGEPPTRQLPWGVFAAVLLVVALALSLWNRHQREQSRLSVHPVPVTAASPPAVPLTGVASNLSSSNPASSNPSASGPDKSENVANSPGETTPDSHPPGSLPPNSPPVGASTVPGPPTQGPPNPDANRAFAAPGEFTVVILAREESWISVTVDGHSSPSEVLAAGSERTVRGHKEITVKTGNSGGVDFRLNGKKLETGGDYGEVKTVTFGPGGILQKAPALPPTP